MPKANQAIRKYAKENGVFLYEIATKFNISESQFLRWIRTEFSPENKERTLKYIDEIAYEKREEEFYIEQEYE